MVNQTLTTITLSWDSPEYLGGRTDLFYRLCYQAEEGMEQCIEIMDATARSGTITGVCETACSTINFMEGFLDAKML